MMQSQRSMVNGEWSRLLKKLAITSFLLLCIMTSFAQQVSTIISKDKIVLGEQISLEIKVQGITPGDIQRDFIFPDTVNHLEILSDTAEVTANSTIIYTLVLTSFDSGYWQLPPFELTLTDQRKLTTEPIGITVLPVDVSNLEDYHDIKDIIAVPAENNWWIIAAIVAIALISLFAFLWFINRRTATLETETFPADVEKMYHQLIKRLDDIEKSGMTDKTTSDILFKEISPSIRSFTDVVYAQRTSHLTTGEYMIAMKGKLADTITENNFFQFLRLADAVKFARHLPPVEEIKIVIPQLRNIINTAYQQNKLKN